MTFREFSATLAAMAGSTWRALAVVGVAALVFAGVALAANSRSFSDAGGDASGSPDLTGVSITNDDAGVVTVKLTLGNRTTLAANEGVAVGLDSDQNPDTGSVFYGAEWELDLEGTAATVYQATPDGSYGQVAAPASYQASMSGGVATLTFKASDFGITSGFNVHAIGFDNNWLDAAPDIRTVNYQLASSTTAPSLQPDRRAPIDQAFKSTGTHGKFAELNYLAMDGRGETADQFVITKGKKVLKRINLPLADTSPFLPYIVRWKVPKKLNGKVLKGALRFCVTSADRAGNKSNQSCAALTIK
jgi:hypothetical protein